MFSIELIDPMHIKNNVKANIDFRCFNSYQRKWAPSGLNTVLTLQTYYFCLLLNVVFVWSLAYFFLKYIMIGKWVNSDY